VGPKNLWLAPRISPEDDFPVSMLPFADTFLLDAYDKEKFGGTGETSDWKGFANLKDNFPSKTWVLAGGLASENLSAALSETSATHIDLNSGIERSPGIKDRLKMEKIFSILHGRS